MLPLSIITVTYNAGNTVESTLKSVAEQTTRNFEHIIIDGKSTDNTLDIISHYTYPELKINSEKDTGIYDAMNKGLKAAEGRFVIFLNAGDRFSSPMGVDKIIKAMNDNPEADVLYGQTEIIDSSGKILGGRHLTAPRHLDKKSFAHGMTVCHQAFVAKKELADRYDLSYRFSADYDWCIRILDKAKQNVYLGDKPLIQYLNEGTTSRNHFKSLLERYRIMCKHYGAVSTTLRHADFLLRAIKRKFKRTK